MNKNFRELYDKVANDSILFEKFSAIIRDAENTGKEETEANLISFVKEAGFDVSLEEMRAFFEQKSKETTGQLSDAELDMVAGGKAGDANIVISVISAGIGCAMISAWGEMMYYNSQGTWDGCQKVMSS